MNPTSRPETAVARITKDGVRHPRSLWKVPVFIAWASVFMLLMASRIIDDWNWPPGAFIVVGILVFGVGLAYELVTRNNVSFAYRTANAIALTAAFLLTWSNFVQFADVTRAAAIYFTVPVVGLIGAILARLKPNGMARALLAASLTQALALTVVLIVLMTRNPWVTTWSAPELHGIAGNAFLFLLFGGSAILFQNATPCESAQGVPSSGTNG